MTKTELGLVEWFKENSDKPDSELQNAVVHLIKQYDSHERLGPLLTLYCEASFNMGTSLFREIWPTCCNTLIHANDTAVILDTRWDDPDYNQGFTVGEQIWFDLLPSRFRVYRGCDATCSPGLSWTLNVEIANYYAVRSFKNSGQFPVVISGMVCKDDILLAMNHHREQEVLVEFKNVAGKKMVDCRVNQLELFRDWLSHPATAR